MNMNMSRGAGSGSAGKKIFVRIGVAGGTLALIVAGAAAFSAFEAHVVNVTATISNALSVNPANIAFGTVFPEEHLNQNMTVALSDSFNATGGVDDVSYFLRQKPTCVAVTGAPVQVTEDANGNYVCPDGSNPLPLLCPFVSEHLNGNTTGLDSFHGPLTGWTPATSLTFDQTGHLSKAGGDITDTWNIDLNVPCFQGQCAQDNKVPPAYQPDPSTAGQMGCALWVEASGISACTVPTNHEVVSDTTNTVEGVGNAAALSVINPGWTASIPDATWIWSTDPVLAPTTVNDTKTFDKTFTVTGTVASSTLDIAADNFFTVYVNGVQVGSEQNNDNNFQLGTQHNYTVSNLHTGSNTIKVVATNEGVANTDPASNPAGVFYKLTYTDTEACSND